MQWKNVECWAGLGRQRAGDAGSGSWCTNDSLLTSGVRGWVEGGDDYIAGGL